MNGKIIRHVRRSRWRCRAYLDRTPFFCEGRRRYSDHVIATPENRDRVRPRDPTQMAFRQDPRRSVQDRTASWPPPSSHPLSPDVTGPSHSTISGPGSDRCASCFARCGPAPNTFRTHTHPLGPPNGSSAPERPSNIRNWACAEMVKLPVPAAGPLPACQHRNRSDICALIADTGTVYFIPSLRWARLRSSSFTPATGCGALHDRGHAFGRDAGAERRAPT